MAGKRTVLGNDPFQRGAAARETPSSKAPASAKRSKRGTRTAAETHTTRADAPQASGEKAKRAAPTRRASGGTTKQPAAKPRAASGKSKRAETIRRDAVEAGREAANARAAAGKPEPAATEAAPPTPAGREAGLLPTDAGADTRRPAVVAVETIAAAPGDEGAPRPSPTALDALEAAATAAACMLRIPYAHGTEVDEFGRDARFAEQVRPLLEWIYDRWFRVVATGFETLPRDVPLVLVANRAGAVPWDSLILALAARHAGLEVRPLVEDSIFHFPSMGLLVNRLGAVRACPENAERILGAGGAVAVFPEGATGFGKPYRERYQLQRFGRGGFMKLALRMQALVVPVSIVGSEEIYPLLGKVGVRPFGFPFLPITPTFPWLGAAGLLPLPARWHIDAGEPFDFRAYGPGAAQDEPLVMRLAEEVRSTVQTLLDARLGQRRSVFR